MKRLSEAGADAILSGAEARPFYGPAFDRLLARRLLEEQAPLSEWDVCDGCECGRLSRPIRAVGDRFRADCPLDPREDVILDEDDLRVFRIAAEPLAREIAAAAGFREAPSEIATGLWHLGTTSSGRAVFLAFARATVLREGLTLYIQHARGGAPATLLAPELTTAEEFRIAEAGVHVAAMTACLLPADGGLGFRFHADLLEPAAAAPRVRISQSSGTIELDGITATLSPQLFPVFLALAEKARSGDPVLTTFDIEQRTGREARDMIRELRRAFVAAGMERRRAAELIPNVRSRGWRLALEPADILIDA